MKNQCLYLFNTTHKKKLKNSAKTRLRRLLLIQISPGISCSRRSQWQDCVLQTTHTRIWQITRAYNKPPQRSVHDRFLRNHDPNTPIAALAKVLTGGIGNFYCSKAGNRFVIRRDKDGSHVDCLHNGVKLIECIERGEIVWKIVLKTIWSVVYYSRVYNSYTW